MPSDKLSTEQEAVLKEVYERIKPAILEIVEEKDSGEIKIFFHEGQFKRAKKEVSL